MGEIGTEDFCRYLREKINPYIEAKKSDTVPQNSKLPKDKILFTETGADSATEFQRQLGSSFRMATLYATSVRYKTPSGI